MRQADASVQQAGLSTVIGKWTEADAWGASQWLGKQPAGLGRDAGFQALATRIAPEEPESAWQWAGAIADPKIREDSLAAVVCEWEKADPTAAWAAVEQASGLTPAARQRLLDAVSHPENLLPPAP